jgi:hypothetical protein
MATDGPPRGGARTAQYQAQKKGTSHLARPPKVRLRLARPKDVSAASPDTCERSIASPDPEGTGSASPDPEGELCFARPQGNGFDRTRRRDVGPLGSHEMTGHAGGRTSSTGAGKDVPQHDLWRGQAITTSPSRPPHQRSILKMRRGALAARPIEMQVTPRARCRDTPIIIYMTSGDHT